MFEPGKSTVGYVTSDTPLAFFVNEQAEIVFLERRGPSTWSDVVQRQTTRRAAAR